MTTSTTWCIKLACLWYPEIFLKLLGQKWQLIFMAIIFFFGRPLFRTWVLSNNLKCIFSCKGYTLSLHAIVLLDIKYFIARILFGILSFFNKSPDAEAVGRVELSEEELAGGLPHRVHLQQRGRRQQHLDRSLSTSAAARRPAATP